MIKAIIFDWGGVLSNPISFRSFFSDHAEQNGKNPEITYGVARQAWQEAKVGNIESNHFWEKVSNHLGTTPQKVKEDLITYFGFNEKMLHFVQKLKPHYKLGLLTNNIGDWIDHWNTIHGLDRVFDVMVSSHSAKMAKPDPRIYMEIVQKLQVKAEECIFIDDLETNLLPANEMGMKTIRFIGQEEMEKELLALGIKW